MRRARVGPASEIARGDSRVVHVGYAASGLPLSVIVVREPVHGELRAYKNECRHLPVPLDAGGGDVDDIHGRAGHLVCRTHGAVYEPDGGLCIEGPCEGDRLEAMPLETDDDGTVWVVVG